VSRDRAILAVDLAPAKQAAVVLDHDSVVLGRRMFTGSAWCISEILAWAGPVAAKAGFGGLVLVCEPDRAPVETGGGDRPGGQYPGGVRAAAAGAPGAGRARISPATGPTSTTR
jgi:hypothetical protein